MRFSVPLRAVGFAAGLAAACWLIEYVAIPALLWAVLALFGAVPA